MQEIVLKTDYTEPPSNQLIPGTNLQTSISELIKRTGFYSKALKEN